MQISVSSTLTLFHDGQFWVGLVEHIEDDKLGVARIVFGSEPSDEEILRFIVERWQTLTFKGDQDPHTRPLAKNPKRRQREASKALKQPALSTRSQIALAAQRDAFKQESAQARKQKREEAKRRRFEQRTEKRKEKKRGH